MPFPPLMKTFSARAADVPRKWWVIDAKDQVLGRVANAHPMITVRRIDRATLQIRSDEVRGNLEHVVVEDTLAVIDPGWGDLLTIEDEDD